MLMVIGCLVVIAGVIIGWYTAASGIHNRPYDRGDAPGAGRLEGESPLDSPWQMGEWSRGTQSRRRRRR